MSYLVLARKWRPQSFEDVSGQEHITRTLRNAIAAKRIAHAYLFTGVRGVGKTTAARILAKALNCENGPTATPCNECSQCLEITAGSSIDVIEIDGASNRGIEEIRQIIENVRYQPARCRFKVYIIDEVHQVTKDAFNALLKTLEEPPPSVKFILATTEPHRLPETILSRCQRYDFRRISLRDIVERLGAISKSEGLKITDGALVLLAREADGSMRDAQSLLEQVLACAEPAEGKGEQIAVDEILLQDILGLAERRLLYDLSAAVLDGDAHGCLRIVAEVVHQGRDLNRLSRDLVEHFRNLLVARVAAQKSVPAANSSFNSGTTPLLDLPDQEIADLSRQAGQVSVETLLDYLNFMAAGDDEIGRSATPRFSLETVLVRLATLPKTLPVAELVERLERLEVKTPAGGAMPQASARLSEALTPPAKTFIKEAPKESSIPAPAPAAAPRLVETPLRAATGDVWRDFVAFVGTEKKFLASHLESSEPLSLPPGPVKIAVSERQHLAYLQDSDNLATLKDLAKRFFTQDVAVQIVAQIGEPSGLDAAAATAANPGDERSPMVKEALRIFGGSIRNVRRET
ncbi:MAG: DNA polymerase III subunit gamma/tau [Deltaproteobacteria bacterium]|nr:DNA polymerase III subunit gamma/tau [Deltaproteobacteria bacterium]